jgi:hypothetical protein
MARKASETGHPAQHTTRKTAGRESLRDHVAGRRAGTGHEQPRNPKTGRFVKGK